MIITIRSQFTPQVLRIVLVLFTKALHLDNANLLMVFSTMEKSIPNTWSVHAVILLLTRLQSLEIMESSLSTRLVMIKTFTAIISSSINVEMTHQPQMKAELKLGKDWSSKELLLILIHVLKNVSKEMIATLLNSTIIRKNAHLLLVQCGKVLISMHQMLDAI